MSSCVAGIVISTSISWVGSCAEVGVGVGVGAGALGFWECALSWNRVGRTLYAWLAFSRFC
jgi:hypothetical protein